MQSRHYPEVPPDFGHWLAGFIDGEGCFIINRKRQRCGVLCAHTRMSLRLRDDDEPILREIVAVTGLGHVIRVPQRGHDGHNRKPQVWWHVGGIADSQRLVELLDRFPLRAKKARDYVIWREAVVEWASHRGAYARDWSRMLALADELNRQRVYSDDHSGSLREPVVDDPVAARDDVALF